MKAAFLVSPGQIEIGQAADLKVAKDEVVIKPSRIGVCGSDVSFYAGHRQAQYPFILGHELVGHVVAVGDGATKLKVGQRIIVEPNYPCGTCAYCRSGRGAICPNKKSMGVNMPGCFSDYATAPAEFVWPIPDTISDADAATIEPLAVSLHALLASGAKLGDTVAVLGCGATGLLLIQAAVAEGLRVIAHDKFKDKLEMARRLGAIIPPGDDIAGLWLKENVTTVFECAGVVPTVETALSCVPRGGLVVLVGLASTPASFIPLRIVREAIRIMGCIIYDHPAEFAKAIDLVARGVLNPAQIVTDTVPFEDTNHALQLASTGQSGKVHVAMG